jgi:hypothetical protein
MFNRIGNSIAERSYLVHVISFVSQQFGAVERGLEKIKFAKRSVPSENSCSSIVCNKYANIDNEARLYSTLSGLLISKQLFSAPYAAQISGAYKPRIFKPPS